ncbi:Transposon TX1 uncharacterized [Zancudomyces culisetae]|uniref:Transposon TX1 uncharacterized n=1 Tax=Zancudomyces culisetae TaxID=1213189 RepID=A0A1R1PI49_ZANCU|nr:Transposon TX1 uncharacterized [Zancudomyces culisetae]|eukprot:OMH80675.1 Transposon TX1 uncharacterized [Zancudomyces culisetae]
MTIESGPYSDYKILCVKREILEPKKKIKPLWKLNWWHLTDPDFIDEVTELLKDMNCNNDSKILTRWSIIKQYNKIISIRCGRKYASDNDISSFKDILSKQKHRLHRTKDIDAIREVYRQIDITEGKIREHYDAKMQGIMVRSRAKWAEKGEMSNKYFFSRLESREKCQSMTSLLDEEGHPNDSLNGISRIASQFYHNLFSSEPTDEVSQDFMLERVTSRVSEDQSEMLEAPISLQEVLMVIRELPDNKSPGPDGISFELYKKFGIIIAKILVSIFNTEGIDQ